jgi:hypothetical protein
VVHFILEAELRGALQLFIHSVSCFIAQVEQVRNKCSHKRTGSRFSTFWLGGVQSLNYSKRWPPCMEPGGSLLCSQLSATGPSTDSCEFCP